MTSTPLEERDDPFCWWVNEPTRYEIDAREMSEQLPDMQWSPTASGIWRGTLPRWPFERAQPEGVVALLDGRGLELQVLCGEAYPMVAPSLIPLDPEPEILERTQHRWHVNGDGSLCLFQDESVWNGRQSLTDLLCKAAGWRVEYALMKAEAIDSMTVNGIVNDDQLDHLISDISRRFGSARP